MPFISTGRRLRGRAGRRAGALLAAGAVAAGLAATAPAAPAAGATGTPYVYVATANDMVTAYDAATGTVTATIPLGTNPSGTTGGVAVTPDGRTAYAASQANATVSVISTTSNTVIDTIPVATEPVAVAVSPDGSTVYVADANNEAAHGFVSVISTASNTITATITVDSYPMGVAFSPDGKTAYVGDVGDDYFSVISTATNAVTAVVPGGGGKGVATTVVPPGGPARPAVTALTPASGPQAGGTSVTITGTGLTGAIAVRFGTVAAVKFTVNSATRITATAPAAASPGTVDVMVSTPGGTSAASAASQYTYVPVPKRADVSAALHCPAAITAGHHGTCTLTVANAGPGTAAWVTASILLPPNLAVTACAPGCVRDPSTATWTRGALGSGAKDTFAVTVRACAPGSVTVLAEATSPTPDPDPYNNAASARVTVTRHRH